MKEAKKANKKDCILTAYNAQTIFILTQTESKSKS